MTSAIVVGNPRAGSRTLQAAAYVAEQLTGAEPDLVLDLATLGSAVLDWTNERVDELVARVGEADVVVFASPTYKGTYTGLLKLFLDRFAAGTGLRGLAVPMLLGAGPAHALAPELSLRPVLTEIGGTVPGRGLFVLDTEFANPSAYQDWLAATRPYVDAWLSRTVEAAR